MFNAVVNYTIYTGSFTASGLRNEAVTGLFLDFWGPQRLLWTPKDGRKLHLGKKHTFLGLMVSPGGCKKKNKIQDLVNWAWYTGCLDFEFCSNFPLLVHSFIWLPEILYFQFVIMKKWRIILKIKAIKEEIMFKTPCISSPIHQILEFVLFLSTIWTHH